MKLKTLIAISILTASRFVNAQPLIVTAFSEDLIAKIFIDADYRNKAVTEIKRLSGNKSDDAYILFTGDVNYTSNGSCMLHITALVGKKLDKNDITKFQLDDRGNFVFTTSNIIPNATGMECATAISESIAKILTASINRIVQNNSSKKNTPQNNQVNKVPFGAGDGKWL